MGRKMQRVEQSESRILADLLGAEMLICVVTVLDFTIAPFSACAPITDAAASITIVSFGHDAASIWLWRQLRPIDLLESGTTSLGEHGPLVDIASGPRVAAASYFELCRPRGLEI